MNLLAFAEPAVVTPHHSIALTVASLTMLLLLFVLAGALAIAAKQRARKEDI